MVREAPVSDTDYMWPVLLGNTLGGVTLVAALSHAQVTSGKR